MLYCVCVRDRSRWNDFYEIAVFKTHNLSLNKTVGNWKKIKGQCHIMMRPMLPDTTWPHTRIQIYAHIQQIRDHKWDNKWIESNENKKKNKEEKFKFICFAHIACDFLDANYMTRDFHHIYMHRIFYIEHTGSQYIRIGQPMTIIKKKTNLLIW